MNSILKICFAVSLILNTHCISFAQQQRELLEQVSFSTRIKNPVKVEAEGNDENIIFYGVNNSFLPYQLEVEFTQIMNLDPATKYYKTILDPGRSRLFELRIRQKNSSTQYNYKIKYVMGNPDRMADVDFPYLIPLSQNKKTVLNTMVPNFGFVPALFSVSEGDTIHAMRKGKVTAIPEDDNNELDRLTPTSLEIYHQDGTLASYAGKDLRSLIKVGEHVYPGQPIGILKRNAMVSINTYQFFKNNSIRPITIKYTADGTSLLVVGQLNGIVSTHPSEIIEKELTKSEMKKWQKGNLYK